MNCVSCEGHGEIICACLHSGQMQKGNFIETCERCQNEGYTVCLTCNGSGYLEIND